MISDIEKLAKKVAQDALSGRDEQGDTIAFKEKVDALKVLTPYYQALKKEGVGEDDTSTMAAFARALKDD